MITVQATIDNLRNLVINPSEGFVGEQNAEMIEIDIGPFAQEDYDFFVLNFDNGISHGMFSSNVISSNADRPAYIDSGIIYCPIFAQHTASGTLKIQLEAHKTQDGYITVKKSSVACLSFGESIMGELNRLEESNPVHERIMKAEERLATAESRVGSAESRLSAVENRAASAENRLSAAENRADSTDGKIASAESRIDSADGKIASAERRIDSAERKIASSETRIASAEKEISSVESRLGSAERKISSAESKIASAESRISAAENGVKSAESRISDIENANYGEVITSLGERTEALEEADQVIDESVKALSSRVSAVEDYKIPENFEGVNQRIDELRNDFESLPSPTEIPVASNKTLGGVKIPNFSEIGIDEDGSLGLRYGNMSMPSLSALITLALIGGQAGTEMVVGNTVDEISSSVYGWSISLFDGIINTLVFASFENGQLTWVDENSEERITDVEKNCIYILKLVDGKINLENYSGNGLRNLILEGI